MANFDAVKCWTAVTIINGVNNSAPGLVVVQKNLKLTLKKVPNLGGRGKVFSPSNNSLCCRFCICAGIWRDGQRYGLRTRCVNFSQMSITEWLDCGVVYKLYESMLRLVKDNENVDQRQHCFLLQTSSGVSRYFSMETKQGLLDVQCAWHRSICTSMMHIKVRMLANRVSRCVCIIFIFGILNTILSQLRTWYELRTWYVFQNVLTMDVLFFWGGGVILRYDWVFF